MPLRAHLKDGRTALVASAAEEEDVKANLASLTGSAAPDAEVKLEELGPVPLADVDRFTPEP